MKLKALTIIVFVSRDGIPLRRQNGIGEGQIMNLLVKNNQPE